MPYSLTVRPPHGPVELVGIPIRFLSVIAFPDTNV